MNERLPRRTFLKITGATILGSLMNLLPLPEPKTGIEPEEPSNFSSESSLTPTPEKPNFLENLKRDHSEEVKNYPGDVALAVVDLQNGKTISLSGEDRHLLGCTAKIFILLSVLRDLQEEKYSPDERDFAIDQMMGPSDDYWTKFLLDKTGVRRINQVLKELGTQKTTFSHAPNYEVEYPAYDWENFSTAKDLAWVLTQLYKGNFFSQELSAYALEKMTHSPERFNNIIPALLPPKVVVAHKIGFFPEEDFREESYYNFYRNTYNDAGIVMTPEFSYVFVYLSQRNDNYENSPFFGAKLSLMAWEAFVREYGKPDRQ